MTATGPFDILATLLPSLMFNTVNVNRPIPSQGQAGGQQFLANIIATAVPCNVQPIAGKTHSGLRKFQEQRWIDISHQVFFETDQGLIMGDILQFGTQNLRVNSYLNLIELGICWVANCQEIGGA